MDVYLVYITTSSESEAREIGRKLVESRLAACANILPKMEAIYWWKDKIEEANEAVLIVKTKESLLGAAIAEARKLHSYECPCIVAIRIDAGNQDYLTWIQVETK